MKSLKKILFSSAAGFVLLICASWTTPSYPSALKDYLAKTDFGVSEKMSDRSSLEKLLKYKAKPALKKRSTHRRSASQQLTPERAMPTSPIIYYSVYEQPEPYMDANLKLSVDYSEVAFEFWSTFDSYATESEGAFIEIEAPIFLQWAAVGGYHISISSYDGYSFATVFDQTYTMGPGNTPDYSSFYQSFYAYYGYDYYISVSGASY